MEGTGGRKGREEFIGEGLVRHGEGCKAGRHETKKK